MGVFFDVPPYPVIDKAPGFWKTAMAATIGALGGFMLAYQNSSGRLMGFFPNDSEVESNLTKN
eukprot:jgi/Astpho2/5947/Aster-x1317